MRPREVKSGLPCLAATDQQPELRFPIFLWLTPHHVSPFTKCYTIFIATVVLLLEPEGGGEGVRLSGQGSAWDAPLP